MVTIESMLRTLAPLVEAHGRKPVFIGSRKCVGVISWRGDYYQASLDSTPELDNPEPHLTLSELVEELRECAAGKVLEGYKGGGFMMSSYTKLYADEYGEWKDTRPVSVKVDQHEVCIRISGCDEPLPVEILEQA